MLGPFVALAAVVIVTPGPDTALTVRNTLARGRPDGVLTAFGVAGGQAVWTIAASAGLVTLVAASHSVFVGVRLAGAGYLVFLGVQTLRGRGSGHARVVPGSGFRQGLLSNLGNPKMAVFFTSLLPQFGGSSFAALLALGLLFCAMTLAWLSLYALAVARMRRLLVRSRVRRALDAVTGAVLVAFGIRLAAES